MLGRRVGQRVMPTLARSGPIIQKRTMVLGGGAPTSFRQDSLLVACTVAALTYFVPQDLVFLTFAYMHIKSKHGLYGGKKSCNAEKAFQEWKSKRGLTNVAMTGSGNTRHATYTNRG